MEDSNVKSNPQSHKAQIAIMLPSFAPGGAEKVVAWLANSLSSKNAVVTLITLDGGRTTSFFDLDSAVPLRSFNLTGGSISARTAEFFRLRRFLADNISLLLSFVTGAHAVSGVVTLGTSVPFIVCERDYPDSPDIGWAKWIMRELAYFRARTIAIQTERFRGLFRSTLRPKLRVIPNAVAQSTTTPRAREKIVLAIGRLVHKKGFDLLIRAWAGCSVDGWKLKICGQGVEESALKSLVEMLGLSRSVEFGGVVHNVTQEYTTAGIFVLPSRYEGFPNVLAEAMAHGVPVIAADAPGACGDLIIHRENGLLVPSENVDALRQALIELMSDSAIREQFEKRAPEIAQRYRPDTILALWNRLIL